MSSQQPAAMDLPAGVQRFGAEQSPLALIIAGDDSRLEARLLSRFRDHPCLLWQTPGPVVPPQRPEAPEVENLFRYAVGTCRVEEIILCTHLPNQAIGQALRRPEPPQRPEQDWCGYYAHVARRIVQQRYGQLSSHELEQAVVEENVFLQLANVRTYPVVLGALSLRKLKLHCWLYDADQDELYTYGEQWSAFLSRLGQFVQPRSWNADAKDPLDPSNLYLA